MSSHKTKLVWWILKLGMSGPDISYDVVDCVCSREKSLPQTQGKAQNQDTRSMSEQWAFSCHGCLIWIIWGLVAHLSLIPCHWWVSVWWHMEVAQSSLRCYCIKPLKVWLVILGYITRTELAVLMRQTFTSVPVPCQGINLMPVLILYPGSECSKHPPRYTWASHTLLLQWHHVDTDCLQPVCQFIHHSHVFINHSWDPAHWTRHCRPHTAQPCGFQAWTKL